MQNNVKVSVIVTTKNEEQHLENCLESIKKQVYPEKEIEIIVVDNNSTDKTKLVAAQYTNKVYNLGPERAVQRNFGIKNATGQYILYLDADMILSEKVISECVEKCLPRRKPEASLRGENENCIALYIPEKIIGRGFCGKVRNFERSFYNATAIDCVRFVQRDKFLQIGGFDEQLTGPEDWDFDRRIRELGKTGIIDAVIYHDEKRFNLAMYLRKKGYYSKCFDKYISKWGETDEIIKKQFGFWYRYFGVFIEHGKWKKLILHPFLTLGMYLLRVLVGFNYLKLKKG